LGSGLKRPLENDEDGRPILKERKRIKKVKKEPTKISELPWEGFSSADELGDSSSEESLADGSSGTQPDSERNSSDESVVSDDTGSIVNGNGRSVEPADNADRKERSSAFKAWAAQQINEALGFSPTRNLENSIGADGGLRHGVKPREPEQDPLPPELQVLDFNSSRKAFSVQVERSSEIQAARLALPVVAEEQKIMEAIFHHSSVVIWGATGSGKTTQVPQFLFEAGFGNPQSPNPGIIGVTQPRRVAAVSMAKRVSDELGGASNKVSYQIRFDSSVGDGTAIKFMTDGILLREIAHDFVLSKYSAVIIDEAHERTVNTDILIGMITRIIDLRESMSKEGGKVKPLKLIIMSATLRIADFMDNPNLFRHGAPPLLQAEGRQHPVTVHFARRTQRDYLDEAFRKISKGHKKLPPGGMLVFLTGQNEITSLAKKLRDTFSDTQGDQVFNYKTRFPATEAPLETEDLDIGNENMHRDLDEYESSGDDNEFEEGDEKAFDVGEVPSTLSRVRVLPLYSQLQIKDQLRVFEPAPENCRVIVLATNVAETSLTIPGIRYVFDCGRAKDKKYDQTTGVQSFQVGWISKASASQRAGRAGRTGPGHCYRLYSSAVYERDFTEHAEPEILKIPVEGVVLQLKSMDLQHVVNFPFPTPPDRQSLYRAEKLLQYLGAVSADGKITPIGRELSSYPLSPRLSKMLFIGHQHECMPYTIALVSALAVRELFIPENQADLSTSGNGPEAPYTNADRLADEAREKRKKEYHIAQRQFSKYSSTSDALKLLSAVCAYAFASEPSSFCTQMFLNHKALEEASSLRKQLSTIVLTNHPMILSKYTPRLPPPSPIQLKALQQFVAAGFIDQIAIRADLSPSPPELPRKPSLATEVAYLPLFPSHLGRSNDLVDVAVFIHPTSVLAQVSLKKLPEYIVYSHLQRGSPATISGSATPKTRMHALVAVSGKQVAALAQGTPLLRYGKPIGRSVEDNGKRECWVVPELVGEKGRDGWPLPALKVLQRKDAREGWVVEKVIG
jgi:ATP-dependent RNA helicase DHX37/DHR1